MKNKNNWKGGVANETIGGSQAPEMTEALIREKGGMYTLR